MQIRANAKVPGDFKSPGTFIMVPKRGLEPRRPKALPPQDSVSTSFTTSAQIAYSVWEPPSVEVSVVVSAGGSPNSEPPSNGAGATGGNAPSSIMRSVAVVGPCC
jgi:hypothetical protein